MIWLIILVGASGVVALSSLLMIVAPALGGMLHGKRFTISPWSIGVAIVSVPVFLLSLYWLGVFS